MINAADIYIYSNSFEGTCYICSKSSIEQIMICYLKFTVLAQKIQKLIKREKNLRCLRETYSDS